MKVYLASPFFNDEENRYYEEMIKILRNEGHKVFVPKEHEIPNAWDLPNAVWAEQVFALDVVGIQKSDVVVVINHGMYSDSGTAWECGYAYAKGKRVLNILCGEYEDDYSLMMTNGTTACVSLDMFRNLTIEQCFSEEKEHNKEIMQK